MNHWISISVERFRLIIDQSLDPYPVQLVENSFKQQQYMSFVKIRIFNDLVNDIISISVCNIDICAMSKDTLNDFVVSNVKDGQMQDNL